MFLNIQKGNFFVFLKTVWGGDFCVKIFKTKLWEQHSQLLVSNARMNQVLCCIMHPLFSHCATQKALHNHNRIQFQLLKPVYHIDKTYMVRYVCATSTAKHCRYLGLLQGFCKYTKLNSKLDVLIFCQRHFLSIFYRIWNN